MRPPLRSGYRPEFGAPTNSPCGQALRICSFATHDLLFLFMRFNLKSDYRPCGDQPQAIDALTRGLTDGARDQVLLGITGSGKTFTVASVIEKTQRPTL